MAEPVPASPQVARTHGPASVQERLRRAATDLAEGQAEALDQIWELAADQLYGLALWRTGNPDDAEDVVQEVFVRLARFPRRLQRARDPRAYLMRMAHNAAIDLVRRRRPTEPLAAAVPFAVADSHADTTVDANRACRHLADLPAPQREALFLRHLAGLSFREIGAVVGVSTFTAATRCRLAIRRLRRAMGVPQ